ncbi:peptidase inhibitor 16-like isoform X2 [Tachysurus fulvidraco]|uniref:peptidase inhibitor 16-like isoform X2 n=1 Tax=Tachysurus fulvidraco TaxID=1234273 RepID=UPI000F4DD6F9|nr:peptidase inhibitor 16-like isoform X2 [Tachysurus fulvidraco]
MIWKTALYYARFGLVLALVSGQLTEEEKKTILNLHNIYRSVVNPPAADMLRMTWDDGLALVAAGYAEQCIWKHNPDVENVLGENLFVTAGTLNVNTSIHMWFDEHENYNYESNTCNLWMCGHYTQVVWAKSDTVGCASHLCRTVKNLEYKNSTILVCNYSPLGNVFGKHPYVTGVPCSNCPAKAIECIENLCTNQLKVQGQANVPRTSSLMTQE